MTVPPSDYTLLALLLAIKNLEVDLSDIETKGFKRAIDLLQLEPDNWESIHNDLIAIINRNASLQENFHNFLRRLDALEDNKKADFLPTEEEIVQTFPDNQGIEIKGYIDGEADLNSRELLNESRKVAKQIVKQENPVKTSKQNVWLKRIEKIL